MKKYLLIYHKEDNDGVFSAALFYNYLIYHLKTNKNNIELFGASYDDLTNFIKKHNIDELPELYTNIIMTDISFNTDFMKKLYNKFKSDFIWCDHHAPIIKDSFKYNFCDIPGVRETNRSAILCVYKYLFDPFDEQYKNKDIPELLRILSAWDSWTYEQENYKFEYVKNINKAVSFIYKLNFNEIKQYLEDSTLLFDNIINSDKTSDALKQYISDKTNIDLKNLEDIGNILGAYDDINNENLIKNFGDYNWKITTGNTLFGGEKLYRTACAIFYQGPTNSTMFKSLIHNNSDDIMNGIVFKHLPDSNWGVSIYNIRDHDDSFHCGDFLKTKYNGGGHKGAAGCTITEDKFIEILKKKEL